MREERHVPRPVSERGRHVHRCRQSDARPRIPGINVVALASQFRGCTTLAAVNGCGGAGCALEEGFGFPAWPLIPCGQPRHPWSLQLNEDSDASNYENLGHPLLSRRGLCLVGRLRGQLRSCHGSVVEHSRSHRHRSRRTIRHSRSGIVQHRDPDWGIDHAGPAGRVDSRRRWCCRWIDDQLRRSLNRFRRTSVFPTQHRPRRLMVTGVSCCAQ